MFEISIGKTQKVTCISVVGILLVSVACDRISEKNKALDATSKEGSFGEDKERLSHLKLGQSKSEVRGLVGSPDIESEASDGEIWIYLRKVDGAKKSI